MISLRRDDGETTEKRMLLSAGVEGMVYTDESGDDDTARCIKPQRVFFTCLIVTITVLLNFHGWTFFA